MNCPVPRRFSIGLSFPGEYRDVIEQVADRLSLAHSRDKILYDKYYEAEFARPDLDVYLPNLYRKESELVVIFLCPQYKEKRWCRLEWRFIKQLLATTEQDRIMLLTFDNPGDLTDLGILPGDGYLDIKPKTAEEIADLILQRHRLLTPSIPNANPPRSQVNDNKESTSEIEQKESYHGKQRSDLLRFFVSSWLPTGPAVALLQGFPGCGKTQLASTVAAQAPRSLDSVEPQNESPDPSLDLLTDLALSLEYEGIHDLMQELEKGAEGDLFNALLRVLRKDKILIIIDEFQRLLTAKDALPPKAWQDLVESLTNSHRPAGRLLLISNRSIKKARWCEKAVSKELKGLSDIEAAGFLQTYLASRDLSTKVPVERLEELGHRLGGNPRALKTLVESLKYSSLEELISLAPDLFKPGDVKLSPDLVEDFERELIQRTLSSLDGDLLKFMRRQSVYRRPFKKEAYSADVDTSLPTQVLRKQLIDRFLLENAASGDTLHPLAREISVTRLRNEKEEWRLAHSRAATYYFRYFKSVQLKESQKLTSSYAELRHHLFESSRIDELYLASEKLTKFALSKIPKPAQSKIPDNIEALEEHVALISALPDKQRPKGLEYHLALCLKHRNSGDDYRKALFHVRKAIGPYAYYAVWLLLIDLEYALNGIDAMIKAQNEALRHLGSGSNAFSVYHRCAHILHRDNRSNDAIKLLEKAINTPGVTCISSIISLCARYMEKDDKYDDAIRILTKGIDTPKIQELGTLYMHCANLMVTINRLDDAISLLKKGINIPEMTKLYSFYLLLAELMVKEGRDDDAISWLKQGMADSRVIDPKLIYRYCAELLVKNHHIEEATTLLEAGIASKVIRDPLPLYHSFAEIMEKSGNVDDGVKFLKRAMANPHLKAEPSIYRVCANLLFHARNLDDAIAVLKQGLLVPKIKEQGQLIQMCAELTAFQGNLDDAIEMLARAIKDNDSYHVYPLYHTCSELMEKAGRYEDAIALMKNGIGSPALTNKAVLYQTCAKLLSKVQRTDEAIALLKKAITSPGITGQVILYQICVKLLINVGRKEEAFQLLKKAISGPKMGNVVSLYYLCSELLIDNREEVISLLKKGVADYPKDNKLRAIYDKAIEQ